MLALPGYKAGATAPRRYVDDLTAWVRGTAGEGPARAAAMGGNNPFRCSGPAHAHIDKSGVFSGWGPSREAMLRLLPGVQPLRTLKDLGVQQLAGAAGMRSLSRGSMPRPGGSNA